MSDMLEIKRALEEQGTAWEEFRKTNDARIKALEEGKSTADFDAKLAKMDKALDGVQSMVEDLAKKANRPGGGMVENVEVEAKSFIENPLRRGGQIDTDQYVAYTKSFQRYIRANGVLGAMSGEDQKTMQAGIDIDGGFLLPTPTALSVVTKMREMSAMRGICGQITISGNAAEGVIDRGDAAASWVGEMATRSATTTPNVGKDRIETFEIYSFPDLSQQLREDAVVDMDAWLTDKVSTAFSEAEDAAFVAGDGVVKPRGIRTYTFAATADATRTWGQLEMVKSGANGAWHTTKADPLMDLIAAFKPGYLANATFLMSRKTQASIRKLKEATSDRYLWEPSMQVGVPARLLGYPVVLDENVPNFDSATGAKGLFLGDFRRGYLIVDRVGMSVLVDPYTAKPKVGFYCRKRVGGAVRDFDAIKAISFES